MAIDVTGADTYFATQLTAARWTAITLKAEALTMAITEIATSLGYNDDDDLDEDNVNTQYACYEQALFLGEQLTGLEKMQLTDIANIESKTVSGLGSETYKASGRIKATNGVIVAPRAKMYLRRLRGPARLIR